MNIDQVLAHFANGGLVIVTDDEARENEGDFILLGEKVTTEKIAFMIRYSSGVICATLPSEIANKFELPYMVKRNQDERKTAYTVSVDVKKEMTTGISARERANTIRALSNPNSTATDFVRPGHIFPVVAVPGGIAERAGHTEAGVLMAQLVGAYPVSAISEVVTEDGMDMLRGEDLYQFADQNNIPVISIEKLQSYIKENPLPNEKQHNKVTYNWADLPRDNGNWSIAVHLGRNGSEHAIVKFGEPNPEQPVLIRVHSQCLTGDTFHSQRCDCGPQLNLAFEKIESAGSGYLIYLNDHEGRGIGLQEKIKAYLLQDQGLDTVEANLELGHEVDERSWSDVIDILINLKITQVNLLTNNPDKLKALEKAEIKVARSPLEITPNQFNLKYLQTKLERMAHQLKKVEK